MAVDTIYAVQEKREEAQRACSDASHKPLRLLAMADIHCRFDQFRPYLLPEADICVIAGDITNWGKKRFPQQLQAARQWMRSLVVRYGVVFWVPGNHDFYLGNETFSDILHNRSVNGRFPEGIMDKTVLHEGFFFHGVALSVAYSWPPLAEEWAYMTVDPAVEKKVFDMPPYVDVVVSHSPPFGRCDYAGIDLRTREPIHIGSPALLKYIDAHQPKLVICGHAHEGDKEAWIGHTRVVNVAGRYEVIELA